MVHLHAFPVRLLSIRSMPIDLISSPSQSQWCWRGYGNYSVVGFSGTAGSLVPWVWVLILTKFTQPRRPWGEHLRGWGHKVDGEGCWLVHSREAWGGWRKDGLGLLARWITVLRGPFKVNHLAVLRVGRRFSHLCSSWNEIQEPGGLKYAAHPLRDGPLVQEAICLVRWGAEWAGSHSLNGLGFELCWPGFKYSKPKYSWITALANRTQGICHVSFSSSLVLKKKKKAQRNRWKSIKHSAVFPRSLLYVRYYVTMSSI